MKLTEILNQMNESVEGFQIVFTRSKPGFEQFFDAGRP
jgi:hypothetical protein